MTILHFLKGKLMSLVNYSKTYDRCIKRHWSQQSEEFTGADSLLTLLDHGGEIINCEIDDTYYCRTQRLTIYVFTLRLGYRTMVMQVVSNPYTERLVEELNCLMPRVDRVAEPINNSNTAFVS